MRLILLTYRLHLPECHSLKEKRRLIKGLKDRLRSRFNVSVAEVDHQELWQRCDLAVAWIAAGNSDADARGEALDRVVYRPGEVDVLQVDRTVF